MSDDFFDIVDSVAQLLSDRARRGRNLDNCGLLPSSAIWMLAYQRFFLKSLTSHRFFPPVGLFHAH